jgi:hypothetical protein
MRLDAFTGAASRLARALRASAADAGLDALVLSAHERPWASATYVGARHHIVLGLPASVARYRWLAALAEAELPMRGHVALPPAILLADDDTVKLEVVTLESH